VALLAAGGLGGVLSQWLRAEKAHDNEKAQRLLADAAAGRANELAAQRGEALAAADDHLYAYRVNRAGRDVAAGLLEDARQELRECTEPRRHFEWHLLDRQCAADHRPAPPAV